jgi:hypothetical protein
MENNAGVRLEIEHATFVTTLEAIRKRVEETMKEL